MPNGNWPNVPCPPGQTVTTARDILDSILAMAASASAPNFDQIANLVELCKSDARHPIPNVDDHCTTVLRAQFFAQQQMWFRCAEELNHGHV